MASVPEASEEVQLSNVDGSLHETDVMAGHGVDTDDPLDIGDVGSSQAPVPQEGQILDYG